MSRVPVIFSGSPIIKARNSRPSAIPNKHLPVYSVIEGRQKTTSIFLRKLLNMSLNSKLVVGLKDDF